MGEQAAYSSEVPKPIAASSAVKVPPIAYPPARWRFARRDELDRVVLWISHIIVRHKDSDNEIGFFRYPGWHPDGRNPTRERAEALDIAQKLAARLVNSPHEFDAAARELSEDRVTRDRGGRMGGVRASLLPPSFLDAVAVLKPGEISKVIESSWGFHVIRRDRLPDSQIVAGDRVVVRYDGTAGTARKPQHGRSHEYARNLAERLAQRARQKPSVFPALVREFSEHDDRRHGGDTGHWSTREPSDDPVALQVLSQLQIGEVSDPVDSRIGFQVLKRMPLRIRSSYAMAAIRLKFDRTAPETHEFSRKQVSRRAKGILSDLRDPTRFKALQEQYCCVQPQRWVAGRGPPGIDAILDTLAFDEIAKTAVESGGFYIIPKRLDPESVLGLPETLFELPGPKEPDIRYLVRYGDGPAIARYVNMLAQEAPSALALDKEQERELSTALRTLAEVVNATVDPNERAARVEVIMVQLETSLGARKYADFRQFIAAWSAKVILEQR